VPQSIGNCTFAYTNATGKVIGTSAGIFLPNNATTVCLVYNNIFSLLGLSLATGFAVDAATGISTPPVVVYGANYNNGVNAIKVSANCISVEATQMANGITLSTANIGTLTTTTPLTSMTQSVVVVPANTADMDTGAQLIGTTASGNYSIGGHHVTTNGVISSTKISVPNVYTYVSAGNWYWRAEVSGSTSNVDETWTVNIVKYAPTVSTATGINPP
jgi:protein involved in ribonucleotide reduction